MPTSIHALPPGYREAQHLRLLDSGNILLINVLALVPLVIALAVMSAWGVVVARLRGAWPGGFGADVPWWAWILALLVGSIIVHEWLHGLAIRWAGHRPRYGVLLSKAAFYATADGAYFPRNVFIVIALAPIVGISLGGMALILLIPDTVGYYLGLTVVLNAANSIGDLWMTAVALRYPPTALIQDEMDSIRVFTVNQASD